jgi:hypothetical protein
VAFEVQSLQDALVAEGSQHDALGPGHVQRFESERIDALEDLVGLGLRCFRLQYDDLGSCILERKNPPRGHPRRALWVSSVIGSSSHEAPVPAAAVAAPSPPISIGCRIHDSKNLPRGPPDGKAWSSPVAV